MSGHCPFSFSPDPMWPLGIPVMAATVINTSDPSGGEMGAGEILETLGSSSAIK